jgi:hypothetical protein
MDFSHSYFFTSSWTPVPNVFGLSNELMDKVRLSKLSRKLHLSKKEVTNFNRFISRDQKYENASERLSDRNEKSDSEERMGDIEVDSEMEGADRFELVKDFMKGNKYGRQNTPAKNSRMEREQKKGIEKLSVKEVKEESKKAWEEDSVVSPSAHVDKVSPFGTPKMKFTRSSKLLDL